MLVLSSEYSKKYKALRAIVDPWVRLGAKTYAAGTLRIGHIPHIAPEAYLHRLGPPLDKAGLELLQDEIGRDLHASVCELLLLHNGMDLYSQYVGINGRRTSYQRSDPDAMMEQPFDMVTPNTRERPALAPEELIFIGSLGDERNYVAIWPGGSIAIWLRSQDTLVRTPYQTVFDFLLEEAQRAETLFDKIGHRIDEH
jgi:hypothetical protein